MLLLCILLLFHGFYRIPREFSYAPTFNVVIFSPLINLLNSEIFKTDTKGFLPRSLNLLKTVIDFLLLFIPRYCPLLKTLHLSFSFHFFLKTKMKGISESLITINTLYKNKIKKCDLLNQLSP